MPKGVHGIRSICSIDGCGEICHGRGLCNKHYRRMVAGRPLLPTTLPRSHRKIDAADNDWSPEARALRVAYLAGFFDGEGCVTISSNGAQGQLYLRIQVTQTMIAPLELFVAAFGGRVYGKKVPDIHKESWYWIATGNRAAQALKEMLPHLIVKREVALIAIEFEDGRKCFGGKGHRVTQEELDRRQSLLEQTRVLNKRGR